MKVSSHFLKMVWDPFSKAFIAWSFVHMSHSIQALIASEPNVFHVEINFRKLLIFVQRRGGFSLWLVWLYFNNLCRWLRSRRHIGVSAFSKCNGSEASECKSLHLFNFKIIN